MAAVRSFRVAIAAALAGLAVFLVSGNIALLSVHLWAREASAATVAAPVGVDNFRVVDARVVRGAAPTRAGYKSLAALGVTTIVDLRAEEDVEVHERLLDRLGIERVRMPVRDGQTPSDEYVDRFIDVVSRAPGLVFVHCQAGVGRTGSMAAAYLVTTGQSSPPDALMLNLEVGPPSLEQVVYAGAGGDGFGLDAVTAVSRVLDAPRRIWSNVRS